MNTPTNWQTTARISNPDRLAFWQEVFGGDTVPIQSILPSQTSVPGYPVALIYLLDLKAITLEQRLKLIAGIANKFDLPIEQVAAEMEEHGCPILADDVAVSTTDRALFMGLVL